MVLGASGGLALGFRASGSSGLGALGETGGLVWCLGFRDILLAEGKQVGHFFYWEGGRGRGVGGGRGGGGGGERGRTGGCGSLCLGVRGVRFQGLGP